MIAGNKVSDIEIYFHDVQGTIITTISFKVDKLFHEMTIHSDNKPEIKIKNKGRVKVC